MRAKSPPRENPVELLRAEARVWILTLTPNPPDFLDDHPGGPKILKRMAGKDSTKQFWKYHNAKVLENYGPKLKVGDVKEAAKL